MLVAHEFSVFREAAERFLLKDAGIVGEIVEYPRLQDHEAGVDGGAVLGGFLAEGAHRIVAADVQDAFGLIQLHGGQRSKFSMRAMEGQQFLDIHVADAVAVCEHEGLVPDVFLYALDAPAGHGVESRIHHGDAPRLRVLLAKDSLLPVGEVECDVAGIEEVIAEPFLDHVLLVARTDDEVIKTEMRVAFHDVPENRPTTDFHHGLRAVLGFFTDAGAEAARQEYDFHIITFHLSKVYTLNFPHGKT